MDPRDAYEAIEWAMRFVPTEPNEVERLHLQHLRELRDALKKEAGR